MACTDTCPIDLAAAEAFSDEQPPAIVDPIAERVQHALYRQQYALQVRERRREQRHPYPYAVYLTPLNHRGQAELADTFVVIGKHLSSHGFDFYHCQPVPHRRVLASFDCGGGQWAGFELDLTWCRFNRNGWYDNGGRFLQLAESPFNRSHLPEEYIVGRRRELETCETLKEDVA